MLGVDASHFQLSMRDLQRLIYKKKDKKAQLDRISNKICLVGEKRLINMETEIKEQHSIK